MICLVLLGRYLEVYVRRRANHALTALRKLQPSTAFLLSSDTEGRFREPSTPCPPWSDGIGRSIERVLLQHKDRVRVLPGEKIPSDGVVMRGVSHVNESMLSGMDSLHAAVRGHYPLVGESIPVAKMTGSHVFGGTLNTDGMLVVQVTKVHGENTVDAIVQELESTLLRKATVELLVDRISNLFVIAAVILAVLVREGCPDDRPRLLCFHGS